LVPSPDTRAPARGSGLSRRTGHGAGTSSCMTGRQQEGARACGPGEVGGTRAGTVWSQKTAVLVRGSKALRACQEGAASWEQALGAKVARRAERHPSCGVLFLRCGVSKSRFRKTMDRRSRMRLCRAKLPTAIAARLAYENLVSEIPRNLHFKGIMLRRAIR
jgi:hypothetical protein